MKDPPAVVFEPKASEYRGRVVKLLGDGVLMEFDSVVDAVRFAADLQRESTARNATVPEDRRVPYRIGINVGDIIVDGDDIYGDAVDLDPNNADGHVAHAYILTRIGRHEEALKILAKAYRLNPKPPLHYDLFQGKILRPS